MSVKITKNYVPVDGRYRSGKKLRSFRGITIHETSNFNKNANAKSHDTYFHNLVKSPINTQVSYHYFVDDKEAYLEIPNNEVAWTCGDGGNGPGNNETISIEICENPECDFNRAIDNSCWIAAYELKQHGIKLVIDGLKDKKNGNLFQHWSWTRKECPLQIRKYGKWNIVISKTQMYLNQLWGINTSPTPAAPTTSTLWTVQVGAWSNRAYADTYAKKLAQLKIDGQTVQAFVTQKNGGGI